MQRAGTNNIVGGDPGRSVASMYLLVRILGEEAKTRDPSDLYDDDITPSTSG
jgi:hypothetical protein